MKKSRNAEAALRTEIRKFIKTMLQEQDSEESSEKEGGEDSEEGSDKSAAELEDLKTRFTGKMKSIQGATEMDTMIESFSDIFNSFGLSSEQKLYLLKGIKSNIVR